MRLWRAARGGLGVQGYLPFAGGFADQPACVIASFDLCSEAAAIMKEIVSGKV